MSSGTPPILPAPRAPYLRPSLTTTLSSPWALLTPPRCLSSRADAPSPGRPARPLAPARRPPLTRPASHGPATAQQQRPSCSPALPPDSLWALGFIRCEPLCSPAGGMPVVTAWDLSPAMPRAWLAQSGHALALL